MKHIFTLLALLTTSVAFGQCISTTNSDYSLFLETIAEHNDGALEGLKTYRLYITTPSSDDVLSAVSGDDDFALALTTTTAFYQSPLGSAIGGSISLDTIALHPEAAYDSYVTIGATTSDEIAGGQPQIVPGTWASEFEAGNSFVVDDAIGGGWYMAPPGQSNSVAGEDNRVMVAQLTTDGIISGQFKAQIFPGGDQQNYVRPQLSFYQIEEQCGCMAVDAVNYDPTAIWDDNSCVFNPCVDSAACNYDPESEGPCEYPETGYDCAGICVLDEDSDGLCDFFDPCVGEYDACGICNGPGEIYACGCVGLPDGSCDCEGNQLDVVGVCGGVCDEDFDNNGVCDDVEVFGCMYQWANNYNPGATRDDGSCESPCVGDVNENVFDWDGDSAVTIADFLAMLAVFGDIDVDSDGVWDSSDLCLDTDACNYANDPSEPCGYIDVLGICGGDCEADDDDDGICDDIDTCVGIEDECGVCNGPGPTEVVIEDITILYDSVYLPQLEEWYVYVFGSDTTFSYECAAAFSTCGDAVSYQGYDYATVQVGEQCWFAENLRNEHYENGDAISNNLSDSEWSSTTSGAVAIFGEDAGCNNYSSDIDACDPTQSLSAYGRLYNWYAVDDVRSLCPSGWHVPTDVEWMTLEMSLGMIEAEVNAGGYRGTDEGNQMKTSNGWYLDGNGSNTSGFSALPGGYRSSASSNAFFSNAGINGYYWTSSLYSSGSFAWFRMLKWDNDGVFRGGSGWTDGFSVRCIKDSE